MKELIVIGGGAAGMSCAVTAARGGRSVLVIEGEKKPLRKLAASGNGRGNLLNRGKLRYHGDETFAKAVLSHCTRGDVEAFWESIGVSLAEEEERVYPSCFSAPTAAEALRRAAEEAGVECRCHTRVLSVQKEQDAFVLYCEESLYAPDTLRKNGKSKSGELLGKQSLTLRCKALALCCGGKAAPEFGTDGSSYRLAEGFGHRLTEIKPALCALTTPEPFPMSLQGQRVKAKLKLCDARQALLAESEGEILFADHAVSGIAAMQLARFVSPGCVLHIDLTRSLCGDAFSGSVEDWLGERRRRFPHRTDRELLYGAATDALAAWLSKGDGQTTLAERIGDLRLPIDGCRGFASAQVTSGGLRCEEWDEKTQESRLCPGLYAAGEILNVDGDCGGYNLLFAVAGGILCGRAVSEKDWQK